MNREISALIPSVRFLIDLNKTNIFKHFPSLALLYCLNNTPLNSLNLLILCFCIWGSEQYPILSFTLHPTSYTSPISSLLYYAIYIHPNHTPYHYILILYTLIYCCIVLYLLAYHTILLHYIIPIHYTVTLYYSPLVNNIRSYIIV